MKNKKTIIKITAYLTVGLLFTLLTSNTKIDSLKKVIKTADHDTTKVKAIQQLAWKLMYSNPDTATILCKQALKLLYGDNLDGDGSDIRTTHPKLAADIFITLGTVNAAQSDYPQALDYYFKSLKIYEELGDKSTALANTHNNIGVIYHRQSDYPRALDYYFKALKIDEELGNKQGMAYSYGNIGSIYQNQSDYPLALNYYFKDLKIEEELGNKQGMAVSYNNIGIIYRNQSDYPLALDYFFKSLKIEEELGNKRGTAMSYTNIGILHTSIYEQGDSFTQGMNEWAPSDLALLDTAFSFHQKAIELCEELSIEYGLTINYSGIGAIYVKKGDYSHALTYYQEAALLADGIGALKEESEAHSGLAECYEKLGNHKLALEHFKQYSTLSDSVFNEEKSKDLGKLEAKHEFEMAEQERKRQEEEQARILQEETERRNLLQYSGILIFIVAFFITLLFSGQLNIPVRLAEGGVFFTFLLVFEFLLVLTDPYLEQWTGGEPAYKLIVNAGLAGLIFPLHSIAETKMKQRLFKTKKKQKTD